MGKYRELGTGLDRVFRNNLNDNFDDIGVDVDELQSQVNQLVVSGDSSVEAAQARVEADGTTNVTLKARLDKKEAEFKASLAQSAKQLLGLPQALLADSLPSDFALQLETFLNTCSNKKVVFPYGKTYTLERQVILKSLVNCEIDFNNCTFALPANPAWSFRESVVGISLLGVVSCDNVRIKNLQLNGNKGNMPITTQGYGLTVYNSNNIFLNGLKFYDVNYHPVYLTGTLKNVKFKDTIFLNTGGTTFASDVYISSDINSDFEFDGVFATRNAIVDNEGQLFYINAYNGTFRNIVAKNVENIIDTRKGNHIIENVISDGSNIPLTMTGSDRITIKNFVATNIKGHPSNSTGVTLNGVKQLYMSNSRFFFDTASTKALIGINIKPTGGSPNNVLLDDVEVKGSKTYAILTENLVATDVVKIKNSRFTGQDIGGVGIALRSLNNLADWFCEDAVISGYASTSSNDDKRMVQTSKSRVSGTTADRPTTPQIGWAYYDTTLNKPIWYKTTNTWIDATGTTV